MMVMKEKMQLIVILVLTIATAAPILASELEVVRCEDIAAIQLNH